MVVNIEGYCNYINNSGDFSREPLGTKYVMDKKLTWSITVGYTLFVLILADINFRFYHLHDPTGLPIVKNGAMTSVK